MTHRLLSALIAIPLLGAALPETRFVVSLPPGAKSDAHGRLLIFAEPATTANAAATSIDIGPDDVAVAGRDVSSFGDKRSVTIDTQEAAYPSGFAALTPGMYRVQAALDQDGSYNYTGRGPGDLLSNVITVRFPLAAAPSIRLDHQLPPDTDQFDVAGLPPRAAEQITASRPHLHDELVPSAVLTRFRGSRQAIAAWVLTPPGYNPLSRRNYPTVYTAGGFGASHKSDGQQLSRQWHMMETGELPPMIWVALDFGTPTGTTEFADSVNNGPWDQALITEVIPALEARYRMDAKPSGRFLTGHSSGGWFALWSMVRHPAFFGGSWATSPDPSDFHDFIGVDLYATNANLYQDAMGHARPLERVQGRVRQTIEQAARLESVLGRDGGQLRSFEWVFSPRDRFGQPASMFDRTTGQVYPEVVAYWRDHYNISQVIRTEDAMEKKQLEGKIHIAVGTADSFYLDGSVHKLDATLRDAKISADITYVPNASHSMREVYTSDGDGNGLWKKMAGEMISIARPRRYTRPSS